MWWKELAEILTTDDRVTFSIDGLEDTNHLYRVNARWNDIMLGVSIIAKSKAQMFWKYIVFAHNEHQIEEARQLAKDLGFNKFIIRKSGRFEDGDPMTPTANWVGVETINKNFIKKVKSDDHKLDESVTIVPRCLNSKKNIGITYDGFLFPCVTSSSSTEGWFDENKSFFSLEKNSISEILSSEKYKELEGLLNKASCSPGICLEYCGVSNELLEGTSVSDQKNFVKNRDRKIIDL